MIKNKLKVSYTIWGRFIYTRIVFFKNVFVFLILFICESQAAQIEGFIYNEYGPIPEANVCIDYENLCTIASDIGRFILSDIDQGEYILIVTHASNKTYKTPIKLDEFEKVSIHINTTTQITRLEPVVITGTRTPKSGFYKTRL